MIRLLDSEKTWLLSTKKILLNRNSSFFSLTINKLSQSGMIIWSAVTLSFSHSDKSWHLSILTHKSWWCFETASFPVTATPSPSSSSDQKQTVGSWPVNYVGPAAQISAMRWWRSDQDHNHHCCCQYWSEKYNDHKSHEHGVASKMENEAMFI